MRNTQLPLALTLLALLAAAGLAQQPRPSMRSVGDVRERPRDEHDRPYFRETQSHRGWEIRLPQFTVFADTSVDDARLAAAHVQQAWQAASDLARRFAEVPEAADFGLNALQVTISRQPLREQDGPATTVNVVGIQTQVAVNVGPGQPPLPAQLVRLREGTALAMLHTAGLDTIAPPWFVAGLASFAGKSGLSEQELSSAAPAAELPPLGGQQWRYGRSQPDTLAYPPLDLDQAAAKVSFLLTAADAQGAPAVFAVLREAQAAAYDAAATRGAFEHDPSARQSPLDELFARHQDAFAAWQANPLAGQPIFEPGEEASGASLAAQQDMALILKLHERLVARAVKPAVPERVTGGPKLIELNSERRPVVRQVKPGASPLSFAKFVEQLNSQPWATLDARGGLLFSTDRQRVAALLAPPGVEYEFVREGERTVLVRSSAGATAVRAWFEPSAQDPSRPIARFASAAANRKIRITEFKRPTASE